MDDNRWKKIANVFLVLLVISLIANIHLIYRALDYRRGANEWLGKYRKVVEEFGHRQDFADANKPFLSDTLVANRIVMFGTQVTERWQPDSNFAGYQVINRGIPGQWISGMLLRYRRDVIELMPQYVIIEVSSYNFRPRFSAEEIHEHVMTMADLARYHGITPILATMVPLRKGADHLEDYSDYSITDHVKAYNAWVKDYCRAQDIACADFDSLLANDKGYLKPELSMDSIDPNEAGYALMSRAIGEILRMAK
jgi:lysophospholipase L1-like esterase